jgi:hypothetical protein
MNLPDLEFDVQHIAILSRKVPEEHALIRLILSSLATPEELENLAKRDLRTISKYFYVKLTSAGKTRISPIDHKTYAVVMEICKNKSSKQRVFSYSKSEMDRIVEKYSPEGRKYNAKKLREVVIEILRDCMFFGDEDYIGDLVRGVNLDKVTEFLYDFHPMYSGMWDIDDDDVAEDFILTYSARTSIKDAEKLAAMLGEEVERVQKLLNRRR